MSQQYSTINLRSRLRLALIALLSAFGMIACTEDGRPTQYSIWAIQQAEQINSLYNEYPARDKTARLSLPIEKDEHGNWDRRFGRMVAIMDNNDIYHEVHPRLYKTNYYIWQYRPEDVYLVLQGTGIFNPQKRLLAHYNFCTNSNERTLAAAAAKSRLSGSEQKCAILTEKYFKAKICQQVPICANSNFVYPASIKPRYRLLYRFDLNKPA